jgi:uroporphyrinogen III methyltransferase/synthase
MSGSVLVTRRAHSWPALVARFRGTPIDVELAPTTEQVEPLDPRPAEEAVARLDRYHWLVLTSGQGVKALNLKLAARGRTGLPPDLHVAAVGPATARACEGTGFPVELVAGEGHAAGLASSLQERMRPDARVLLVRPEGAHGLLAAELRARGALVDEAPLYRTVPSEGAAVLADRALAGAFAGVAFTAPSSLDRWIEAAGPRGEALHDALRAVVRVAIGPTTAAHLDARGLRAQAIAAAPDEDAVGDAIAAAFAGVTW